MAAVQAAASRTLEHVDTDYRAAQEQLLCAGEDRDLKLAAMQLLLALQKERVLLMRKGAAGGHTAARCCLLGADGQPVAGRHHPHCGCCDSCMHICTMPEQACKDDTATAILVHMKPGATAALCHVACTVCL